MVLIFFLGVVLVIIAPFLHPANKVGDTPPLPYYLYVIHSHLSRIRVIGDR
jgi:L-type amino acid transporter 9